MPLREEASATRSVTTFVAATPQAVWRIVSNVPRTATWSDEIVGCTWDDEVDANSAPQPGQSFTARLQRGEMRWSSRSFVISADPGRQFAFAVSSTDEPTAVWTYELEPAAGGCRLYYSVTLGDGPSMFEHVNPDPAARLELEQFRLDELSADMAKTLEQIRLAAEARPA